MARTPGALNKPKTRMVSIEQLSKVFAPNYMIPIDRVLADAIFGPEGSASIAPSRIDDDEELEAPEPISVVVPVQAAPKPKARPVVEEDDEPMTFVRHAPAPQPIPQPIELTDDEQLAIWEKEEEEQRKFEAGIDS